jgi:uracil-DNA glycosylase
MSLTRDDMLRELELLPVWKLRSPVEAVLTQKIEIETLATAQVSIVTNEESALEEPAIENPSSAAVIQYEITMSQDKQWAFVCESDMAVGLDTGTPQITLFNNILQALSIEKPSKMQAVGVVDVQANMIVAMGESVAQVLLNTQEPLENLRGKLHPIGNTQLLATCDLMHLLNNPLEKAQVWHDLCLARSYLQGLHVQD